MRSDSMCRVCLREATDELANSGRLRPIFRSKKRSSEEAVSCADMLNALSPYSVSETDGFPSNICHECYKNLCSAYKFRQLCESSYMTLLNYSIHNLKREACEERVAADVGTSEAAGRDIENDSNVKSLKIENLEQPAEEDYDNEDESLFPIKSENGEDKFRKSSKTLTKQDGNGKIKVLKIHSCSLCMKTFKWKHRLLAHLDSHYGIKRYFCDICKKVYRNEKDHKNYHKRGFKFQCDACAKCFNTKAKLMVHRETHSTDRAKFFCTEEGCEKVFLSQNGLDRHKMSHAGLKNFICQMCSKSFIDKYQLEVHLRIHTGERKYSCSYCDKKFITTSAKNSHERWHTKTKNYACQHCERAFVSSSGLKRHALCHTKELPQECRFCGKKFARYDNRKRHEMSTHQFTEKPSTVGVEFGGGDT